MISDQRAHHRVSFFLGADVYKDPAGQKTGRAIIRDISFSGVRIETLEALEQGENVYLDFEIAGKFPFRRVPALVTRTYHHAGSYLAGLSFQRGEDRRHIRQALTYMIESST